MSSYSRPHLSFDDQLTVLKARGLSVTDDTAALSYLRRLGYYRLSAYWYPFRRSTPLIEGGKIVGRRIEDDFVPGATFQSAVELYVFDKHLRMLVMDAIERIEVAVRVDIAHFLGERHTFAHTEVNELHGHFAKKVQPKTGTTKHADWLAKLDELTGRSKEEFVKHYRDTYGLPLPVWVAIEVWDFGLLSNFYAGMKVADQAALSTRFGVPDPEVMASWLRTLNYVRNIAAHHSRFFNRNMIDQPKMPKAGEVAMFDPVLPSIYIGRPYATLCILSFLMRQVCPSSTWQHRVVELLGRFPASASIRLDVGALGCHPGWESELFWN